MIYLDNNATTRPLPEVITGMNQTLLECWANPSSKHPAGQQARSLLSSARTQVASLFEAHATEVVFTSGATEANHHALHGALLRPGAPRRIILSAIEHAAYLKAAQQWQTQGVEVCLLPVDAQGRVLLEGVAAALARNAALISVMAANNETGVLQPIAEIAALARAQGIPFHVDATQIAGKLPLSLANAGADLLSLSAHKLHGPKGVGALLIRKGLTWPALFIGQQERARRGGTENLPGIIGFALAAHCALNEMATEPARQLALRETFEAHLAKVPGCIIHGLQAERLPNTTSLRITGLSADKILGVFEREGICASSGAACSSGGSDPSHVLLAMGIAPQAALGAIRISIGRDTTATELDRVIELLQAMRSQTHPSAALIT